ncbi:Nucleotide-binding universal stress protein, UspA family [Tangfeifania diversioriginum]|uniref:Nucleotide-binding universal stress protein, UspA family n=1 Tax=Tangfeifania diversioriginum TaxID=1168035 RepID=A0A1M6HM67_9BACT|nr:universal stress protein [Tangfeifania diversioriginum]SHJ23333.1 Nucleotide-binding universal stress protein, UspA family [Tangfeifania diversioriginum]
MEERLLTLVVLPYSKAQILKARLEENEIECYLEDINLMEGAATSVKVKIMEKDVREAFPVLEKLLGKKPIAAKKKVEKKDDHILVPVDFSTASAKSCKMAFNIASHLGTKLVFMHCYINPIVHSVPYGDVYMYDSTLLARMDEAEKNANEDFQKFTTKLVNDIGKEKWDAVETDFIIKSGYADEDILAYAEDNNSRLIVMGTGDETANVIGSITADIIYNAKVPVLVVPEKMPEKELSEFNRVLYATNFDEKDFLVIEKLVGLLKPFEAKVFCVHVGKTKQSDWDTAKLEGMKEVLNENYQSKDFDCRLISGDDILEALDSFIEKENIDIISLTTHKRNMISRLFNPSVARKMVFHTQTPLLIFHA